MLKIVTWNLNGIRSSQQDLKTLFDSLECDIICLQETKITRMTNNSDHPVFCYHMPNAAYL